MKVTPVIAQGGRAGLVEHQLQGVAVQQVDAVEGGVLRRGVDLRQHVVVLRDQADAGACEFGSATGAAAVRPLKAARRSRPPYRDRADRRRRRIVGGEMLICRRRVDAGLQVIGRQRRVELVQRRNLAGAGAEGDARLRAAAGGADRSAFDRRARQAVTERQAELGQGVPEIVRLIALPVDGDRRRRRPMPWSPVGGIDGREQVGDVVADADVGAAAGRAGGEGEGGAVDDQRVAGGQAAGESVRRRAGGAGQERRAGDRSRRGRLLSTAAVPVWVLEPSRLLAVAPVTWSRSRWTSSSSRSGSAAPGWRSTGRWRPGSAAR